MWQETNYLENSNDVLIPENSHKINPALIESIENDSIADEVGFESGDASGSGAAIATHGRDPTQKIK